MKGSLSEAALKLKGLENILILTHKSPDGDAMGSSTALYYGLKQMGKRVTVRCSDPIPKKFGYLFGEFEEDAFEPEAVVTVDVADPNRLGDSLLEYADRVNVCIDHHITNGMSADCLYVDETAAATCEIIYDLLKELGIDLTKAMMNSLYTGVCTDTGCFKFSNTTAKTHRIAAELIAGGCDYQEINTALFDTKSRKRLELERVALDSMEFYFEDRMAVVILTKEILERVAADSEEVGGIVSIPRQVEGVDIGVVIREEADGKYKISIRTSKRVNAAQICEKFGGGGHLRAAGCTISSDLEGTKKALFDAVEQMMAEE